jgi:hypothetical protein
MVKEDSGIRTKGNGRILGLERPKIISLTLTITVTIGIRRAFEDVYLLCSITTQLEPVDQNIIRIQKA